MDHMYKHILIIILLFAFHLKAQKKSYDGQGAVSEIIMASEAEMMGHFDMFFKSSVPHEDHNQRMYWYKIVFNKACTFDFTLFPLVETDRYSFIAFKTENNLNFCDAKVNQAITTINDIHIARKYTDTDQSESFRSNLVTTKKVPVKAGEAVYLVIKNLWGKDLGHIIGLNTCDYSYVLKVEKFKLKTDSMPRQELVYAELKEEEALAALGRKLCPVDNLPVKLGTVNFSKKIDVSNQLYLKGESQNGSKQKITATDITPSKIVESKLVKSTSVDTIIKRNELQSTSPNKPSGVTAPLSKEKVLTASVQLKNKQPDLKLIPVKCIVTDIVKNTAIENAPAITDELTGKPVNVKKIKMGEYEFAIEKGKTYRVECNAIGYKGFDHSINISKIIRGEETEMELKLQPLVAGENFILKNIYFNANTPVIKSESNKELERLYTFMKNNPDAVISIEGHTNSNRYISRDKRRQQIGGKWAFHGSAHKLSKYRADEVSEYLVKRGIEPYKIKTKGWGGDRELYPNARTLDESSKNMRVEVVILKI